MKNKILGIIFACLTFFVVPVSATEKIESFDSLIQVQTDGSMIVTEKITVHHEGINIRRGIYRDLPTKKGERYELIGVNRNGHYEPSFVERRAGYYRINTGNDNYLPHPGTSTFEIKYKVWNLPKSYGGYDEVYWNVTGDEWAFPIENVSAKIELPYEADIIQQASYIGYKGSTESATYEGNGQYTGRYLSPGEQLTIAVGFTPGIVSTEKHVVKENASNGFILFIVYLVYLGFLIWTWHKKGRDPAGHAIMPQYEAPKELTAAQAAHLYYQKSTSNLVPTALIQMISNGFLKLTTTKEKILCFTKTIYTLEKQGKAPSNSEEECVRKKIILDGQYHSKIANLARQIESKTAKRMKSYYTKNYMWILLPTLIYFLILVYLCAKKWSTAAGESIAFGFAFCLPVGIFIPYLLYGLFKAIRAIFTSKSVHAFISNIIPLIIACWFLKMVLYIPALSALELLGWKTIYSYISPFKYEIIFWLAMIPTYAIFSFLMYQPTEKGLRLIEHLEGLKMFLKATKLPVKNKQEIEEKLSQENMEKLFPYALALGLEKEWETKFTDLFGTAVYHNFATQHPYLSHSFCSSFASNVSCCSHSGNGGGSGGGGCSGGGGGGGGGGGR